MALAQLASAPVGLDDGLCSECAGAVVFLDPLTVGGKPRPDSEVSDDHGRD